MLFAGICLTTVNRAVLYAESFYIEVNMKNIFRCTAWNRNKAHFISHNWSTVSHEAKANNYIIRCFCLCQLANIVYSTKKEMFTWQKEYVSITTGRWKHNIVSAMQSVPKGERIFRVLVVKCELAFENYLLIMFWRKVVCVVWINRVYLII